MQLQRLAVCIHFFGGPCICIDAFYQSSPWLEPSVECLLEPPVAELSLHSNLLSISIPHDQGKHVVYQAEPLHLARLNTTGRLPGIPVGAVKDRLTHCHSSLRHGTHTLGLEIVSQGLLLQIRCVLRNRVTTRRIRSSPRTDSLGQREAIIRICHPRRIARALLRPPVSPLGNMATPVRPSRLPLIQVNMENQSCGM